MKDLMDTIINIDRSANEKLKQAIQNKEEEMERIKEKKKALSKQIKEYADTHLASFEESEKLSSQDGILAIKNSADEERDHLDSIYEKYHQQWIDEIVSHIIKS